MNLDKIKIIDYNETTILQQTEAERMQYLTVRSLPEICFAHTFGADSYQNEFPPLPNTIEITYISEGCLRYISKGEDLTLKKGDIIINTFTRPLRVQAGEHHEHHTAGFHMQFSLSDTPDISSVPTVLTAPPDRCLNLIDDIIRAYTIDADSSLKTAGLCLQLLYEMSASPDRHGISLYVKKAKNYVFQHLHEPIRQADIADALGITPEYLCNIFKQCENTTVMSYINHVKLDKIRTVLEKEHLPLYKASELYGYTDPNYVSRLYKKMFHANISDHIKNKNL